MPRLNGAELLLGAEALQRHGARAALTCADETLTYHQLAQRVARSAAAFAQAGVRSGDCVVLIMQDTPEAAAAWLGVVRLGAVAIALNNRLSAGDLQHILADGTARVALVEDTFASEHATALGPLAREGRMIVAGPGWRARSLAAPAVAAHDAHDADPAFALYTSGTTGKPKGILHTHASFRQLGQGFRAIGIGADEKVFTTSKVRSPPNPFGSKASQPRPALKRIFS